MDFKFYGYKNVPACKGCNGDGENMWDADSKCSVCEGKGYITKEALSYMKKDDKCSLCGYTVYKGYIFNHNDGLFLYCDRCHQAKIIHNQDPRIAARLAFWMP